MSEPAIHTSTSVCRAFVGGDAVAAHEYHDCDFCFEVGAQGLQKDKQQHISLTA